MTLKKLLYRTRVHITRSWKKALMMHPLLRVVFISLLAAQATPNTVWAQVKAVPPLWHQSRGRASRAGARVVLYEAGSYRGENSAGWVAAGMMLYSAG